MIVQINAEQEEKLDYIRGLRRKHSEHLENAAKLLETAIQTLDESEMALFLQVNLNTPEGSAEAFRGRGKWPSLSAVGVKMTCCSVTSPTSTCRCWSNICWLWKTPERSVKSSEDVVRVGASIMTCITDRVFLVTGHQTSATEVSKSRWAPATPWFLSSVTVCCVCSGWGRAQTRLTWIRSNTATRKWIISQQMWSLSGERSGRWTFSNVRRTFGQQLKGYWLWWKG